MRVGETARNATPVGSVEGRVNAISPGMVDP